MATPIKRGFSKLAQFSGRDTRGEFWPYAAAVFVLFFVTNFLLITSLIAVMVAQMSTVAAAGADVVTLPSSTGEYPVQLVEGAEPPPAFHLFFVVYSGLILVVVMLLAAAVARRLHDRNMAGYWGGLPLPFLAVGMTAMPILMGSVGEDGAARFDLFGLLAINNVIYLVALGTLIILLALKGTPGPNRYGAERPAVPIRPVEDWSTPS